MKYVECPEERSGAGTDLLLFLGGGITGCSDWQQEMKNKLSVVDVTLLNPRRKNWDINDPTMERAQIEWEHRHMTRSDAILFWFASETLCPITLFELGKWVFRPKKLFIGCHPDYKRKNDVIIQTELERPFQKVVFSLDDLANQVKDWVLLKKENHFVRMEDQPLPVQA